MLVVILLGPEFFPQCSQGRETRDTGGWAPPANSRFLDFTQNDKM